MRQDQSLPGEPPGPGTTTAKSGAAHRILLVDDDHSLRQVMATMLTSAGHEVDAVEDGLIAWEILQHKAYDLLLTDVEMPRISGVELVKKLRAARMDLPVVLVSGRLPPAEMNGLPWLHLAATLAKPFTGEELRATVDDVLHRNGERESDAPPRPVGPSHPSPDELVL